MNYPTIDPEIFNPVVWHIVRQVPRGVVSTYGQVASMISPVDKIDADVFRRLSPRWVGDAMNAVSFRDLDGQALSPGVPWWRIINAKGGISLPAGSNAAIEQRVRLEAEGVNFTPQGLVDLDEFGWDGPAALWLTENEMIKPKPLRKPPSAKQMNLF